MRLRRGHGTGAHGTPPMAAACIRRRRWQHNPACCQSIVGLTECLHCRCMARNHKGPSFTPEPQAPNSTPHARVWRLWGGGAPLAPDASGPLNRMLLRNPAAQLDLHADHLQHPRSTGVPRPVDGGATGSNSPHLPVGQSTSGAAGRSRHSGLQARFGLGARHRRGCTPPTIPRAGSGRRRPAGSRSSAHTHAVLPSSSHGGSHLPVSLAASLTCHRVYSPAHAIHLPTLRVALTPPPATPFRHPPATPPPPLTCHHQNATVQDPGAGAAIRRGAYGASRVLS
jgi:hypothetical protein